MAERGFYKSISVIVCCFFTFVLFLFPQDVVCSAESKNVVRLVEPEPGVLFYGKKPHIRVEFSVGIDPNSTTVVLDNSDVTELSTIEEHSVEYTPIRVLPAGQHTLIISCRSKGGEAINREFHFETRHYKVADEFYSASKLTFNYDGMPYTSLDDSNQPDSKLEANLHSSVYLKKDNWFIEGDATTRYLDQNTPALDPMGKGVDLINYLVTARRDSKGGYILTQLGDITVDVSENTICNLTRRGGKFGWHSDLLSFETFSMRTQQSYGIEGGTGISDDMDSHIFGVTGKLQVIPNVLQIRALYATAGEEESSFGIYNEELYSRGDVFGIIVSSSIWDGRLGFEAEWDVSRYDQDSTDEFGKIDDRLYRIEGSLSGDFLSLRSGFIYIGPDYQVVSNPGVDKDKEGIYLDGQLTYKSSNFDYHASWFRDNVDNDELYPKMNMYDLSLNYNYTGFNNWSLGLNVGKSIRKTSDEPDPTTEVYDDTSAVGLNIGYFKDIFSFNLQTGYSYQNDHTSSGNDSSSINVNVSPSINLEKISITPSFSFNRSEFYALDQILDTFTWNLDVRGTFFERVDYQLSSTYTISRSNDDSVDEESYDTQVQISYLLGTWRYLKNASLALKLLHNKTVDHVYGSGDEAITVMLTLNGLFDVTF